MKRIFGGATLIVAGIAAFIEAHAHRPIPSFTRPGGFSWYGQGARPASGLSSTAYDLLRIGAWALVIFGALLVLVGLIRTIQQGA